MKEWKKISLTAKERKTLEKAKKETTQVQLLQRLQCVELKDKGWKHKDLSAFFGVCMNTVTNWLELFVEGGIEGLQKWDYKGRESKMTESQIECLKERHEENPFDTAKEAKAFIENEFKLYLHLHWVQKLLKKNFDCHTKKQLSCQENAPAKQPNIKPCIE